jgi:hypothetical protein
MSPDLPKETENAIPFQAKIGAPSIQRLHSAATRQHTISLGVQVSEPEPATSDFEARYQRLVVDPIRNWSSDSTDNPVQTIV